MGVLKFAIVSVKYVTHKLLAAAYAMRPASHRDGGMVAAGRESAAGLPLGEWKPAAPCRALRAGRQ